MRNEVVVAVLALTACWRGSQEISAVREIGDAAAPVAVDAPVADAQPTNADPTPTKSASRARFASVPLTLADHGIDGAFELWRDKALDDTTTHELWMKATWERLEDDSHPPPRPLTAQLILRDSKGKVIESLDLGEPLALLSTIRLGDDPISYVQVDIDTYKGWGRWGGATSRFVRIEKGHSVWLPCAVGTCALGCAYSTDKRPSGGFDLLVARHAMDGAHTEYERIEIASGKCHSSKRSVKGWIGEFVTIPPIASFPPRKLGS